MPSVDRSVVALLVVLLTVMCALDARAQGKKAGGTQGAADASGSPSTKQGSSDPSSSDPNAPVPIETYTLAYNALRGDAIKIANRIAPTTAPSAGKEARIIFFDRATFDDIDGLRVTELELAVLNREICNIVTPPPGGAAAAGGTDVLSGVGSIISATASLLQAVTPDSTATNAEAKIPTAALTTEVARALMAKQPALQIFVPRFYVPFPSLGAVTELSGCPYSSASAPKGLLDSYRNLITAYARAQTLLVTDKPHKLSDSEKTALKEIMSRIDSLRNQLEGVVVDQLAKGDTPQKPQKGKSPTKPGAANGAAPDDGSAQDDSSPAPAPAPMVSPLIRFARVEAFLEDTLKGCQATDNKALCYVLYLRVGQAGGGTIVKKWVFHPTWYYYSGGTSSFYALLDLGSGRVRASGTVSTVTNYMKLGTFQKKYSTQRRFDPNSERLIDLNKDGHDEDH
jgi:hypothetical protein